MEPPFPDPLGADQPPPPPKKKKKATILSRIASSASPTPDTVRSADPWVVGDVLGVWGFGLRDLVGEDLGAS